jgi:hypothetical protein
LGMAREGVLGAGTEGLAGLAGKVLKGAALARKPITFPSGEEVTVTPGVKAGQVGAVERVASQMLAGKPLRTARAAEQGQLQTIMKNIANRAATRAGAVAPGTIEETWRAFSNSGAAILDTANPIYNSLKVAMRDPAAATPPMTAMVDFARDEYIRSQSLQRLITAARSGADPAADIAPRQLEQDVTTLASLQRIVKLGTKPEQVVRQFVDAFGGGDVSVFDIFQRMRSNLRLLVRERRLSPSDKRIAAGLVDKLTESMEQGLRKTGGESAVRILRRADRLWSQGRSMQELSQLLNKATTGIPTAAQVQAPEVKRVLQSFRVGRLAEGLSRSMIEDYPGGPSLLKRSIPDQIDRETYVQTVDTLVRSLKAGGGGTFAARIHGLGILAGLASIPTLGAVGGGAVGAGAIAAPEIGAYIVSKAMTSKLGAKLLQSYMAHRVGTQEGIKAAMRLAAWALESSRRTGEEEEQ